MSDAAVPDRPAKPQSLLQRFGSRNHPDAPARKARVQKARAGMAVPEETVVNYTAARGFLYGEWLGACLMVASMALVYLFTACPRNDVSACQPGSAGNSMLSVGVSLGMFAVGTWVFWSNHTYYKRLDFPWAKRWDNAAIVVAGAGAVFWLLFGLIAVLVSMGITVLPAK